MTYVVATSKNWRPEMVGNVSLQTDAHVSLIADKKNLNRNYLDGIGATTIFFPHWSYIIPSEIYENYECIIFHMTDLPFGRGGSPLQNLIVRGISETKISALRCVKEVDAGPIYMKRPLSLQGTAQDIYVRASAIIEDMIVSIIEKKPDPQDQTGEVVLFKRRKERDGSLSQLKTLEQVYDHIRMLDAEGYPNAFIETDKLHFEFKNASIKSDYILADVMIMRKPDGK
jgi:methionyl-tRNA formyltransferase